MYGCLYNPNNAPTISYTGHGSDTSHAVVIPFSIQGPASNAAYSNNAIVVATSDIIRVTANIQVNCVSALPFVVPVYYVAIGKNGNNSFINASAIGNYSGNTVTDGATLTLDIITTCNPGDTFALYFADVSNPSYTIQYNLTYSSLTIESATASGGGTGSTGPVGPQGPTGAQGPVGPPGITGPAGSSATGAGILIVGATSVPTPVTGKTAFFNTSNSDAFSTKDIAGTVQSYQTQLVINVQDYPWSAHANSDGEGGGTDDSVAINKAIVSLLGGGTNNNTGGETVFLPAGQYRLSHPIHIPCCITLRGAAAGSPDSGTTLVPDDGVQAIVVEFGDTYSTGLYADESPLSISTTIASTSIGQSLPQTTINVVSTAAFTESGEIMIQTAQGFQPVTYTGKTPTSFTGCPPGTTVAAGSDGFVLTQTPSSFQVAAVPAGWPATGITVDAFLQTTDGQGQQVQWTNYTTVGGTTTFSDFRSIRGGEGVAHTGYALTLTPGYGTMLSTSAVLQGTPYADGSWCVIKDLNINAASSTSYPQWAASTAHSIGDCVVPLAPFNLNPISYCGNGFKCVAVTGNAETGLTEPLWVNVVGPTYGLQGITIVDNNVTWQTFELAHGIRLYEISKLENIYIQNMGGDGIRGWGSVGDNNVPSQCSVSRIDYCRVQNCFGYALALGGADGSACLVSRVSGSSNRAGGVYDFSFLGNTYIGCQMEENGAYYGNYLYEYASVDGNAASLFLGCYKEDGVFILQSPAMAVNCPGFEFSSTTPFTVQNGQYLGTGDNSTFLVNQNGTSNVSVQIGELDNTSAFVIENVGVENTPVRLLYNDAGSGSTSLPYWSWCIYNTPGPAGYSSMLLTGENHRESGQLPVFPRGIFIGPNAGDGEYDSGPLLTNGISAPTGVIANLNNQWRVGDKIFNYNPVTNGIESWLTTVRGGLVPSGVGWTPNAHHYGGDLISVPTGPTANVYRAIGTNYGGATLPAFPTGIGNTVADGSIYWEMLGSPTPLFAPEMFLGGRIRHNMTSDADYTLSINEQFANIVEVYDTGVVLTATRNIILPLWDGAQRTVFNNTAQSLVFKSASGTGITVTSGNQGIIYCNGINWISVAPAGLAVIPTESAASVPTPVTSKVAFYDPNGGGVTGSYALSSKDPAGNTQAYQTQMVVNVKDYPFGAKGDGITDDTAAFVAALTYLATLAAYSPLVGSSVGGGVLFIPAGVYILSMALAIPRNVPMTIAGEGKYVSQLKWTTAVDGFSCTAPIGVVDNSQITIRDLQLVNSATASLGVTPSGQYWQPGLPTTTWGPIGTLIALPGQSNRLLRLTGVGTTGPHVPFAGGHAYCSFNGTNTATTIAAGSNLATLPQGTIYVASTVNMLASGTALVTTDAGVQSVAYTGITATTLTGCTGGTGLMHTGGLVECPTPYPIFSGQTTADITQVVCEVGDAGIVSGVAGTMDFRTSYDGGATYPTGYQFAVTGGNAIAHGLTVTFPAGNYGAPSFYASPPMGAGFSNIIGDVITDNTAQWTVTDGTDGILLLGQGNVHIDRVSVQGFTNAIILDNCINVWMSGLDLGSNNGLWICQGNERLNAPGTASQVTGLSNAIYVHGAEIFCYGVGYADSGGINRSLKNINFESSTSGVALATSTSSAFAWIQGVACASFEAWTGEGAFWGYYMGDHLPFTGGMQNGVNKMIRFKGCVAEVGQNGFGGPAVAFGDALGGAGQGTPAEQIGFEACILNAAAYAGSAVEGIPLVAGISIEDSEVTSGGGSPFDNTEAGGAGGLFFYRATQPNAAGVGMGINCQPKHNVDLCGSLGLHTRSITGAYVVDAGINPDYAQDHTILMSGGPYAVTLPDPTINLRRKLVFKATDSSAVTYTITPHASETIDGASTYAITLKYASVELTCDGTNWFVTASYNGTVI